MATLSLSAFSGMRPAAAPQLLGSTECQHVSGADLASGELRPMALPVMEAAVWQPVRSLWLHKDVWRLYEERRNFALNGTGSSGETGSGAESPKGGRLFSSLEAGGLRFQAQGQDSVEYVLGLTPPTATPLRDGEAFNRTAAVRFTTGGFTFVGEAPFALFPGDKVSFTGSMPSGLTADTVYVVLGEAQGLHSLAATGAPHTELKLTGGGEAVLTVHPCELIHDRAYVFTVVNAFGDESAPSPPSVVVSMDAAQGLRLKGLTYTAQSGESPISAKRIYRTATGTGATDWLFVAEVDAQANTFTDNLTDGELAEPLATLDWDPPASGLRHVVELPGGMLAAHDGDQVWLSEPFAPYAWPQANRYGVRGPVVALAASQRTVFAFTESQVHALTVEDADLVYATTLDGLAPCLSADGVVSSPLGAFFPSVDGLYLVAQGATAPENVTAALLGQEDWQALNPASFLAVWVDTTYLAFYEDRQGGKGALLLDFGTSGEARMRLMDAWGTALQVIPHQRKLYMAQRSGSSGQWRIYHLFAGTSGQTINWRSRALALSSPVNMAALLIEGGYAYDEGKDIPEASFWSGPVGEQNCGETPFGGEQSDRHLQSDYWTWGSVRLIADGKDRAFLPIRPGKVQALPGGYSAKTYELEINARVPIRRVALATTTAEVLLEQV